MCLWYRFFYYFVLIQSYFVSFFKTDQVSLHSSDDYIFDALSQKHLQATLYKSASDSSDNDNENEDEKKFDETKHNESTKGKQIYEPSTDEECKMYYQQIKEQLVRMSEQYHGQFREMIGYEIEVRTKRFHLSLKPFGAWSVAAKKMIKPPITADKICMVHPNWETKMVHNTKVVIVPDPDCEPIVIWSFLESIQSRPQKTPVCVPWWFPLESLPIFKEFHFLTQRYSMSAYCTSCFSIFSFL